MRKAKTCAEKIQYPDYDAARCGQISVELALKRKTWPYQCDVCQLWHLTTKRPENAPKEQNHEEW